MAKFTLEIEADGERTALTEMLNDISGAMDAHPEVRVRFSQQLENNTLVAEPSTQPDQAVTLRELLDENSSSRARKAVSVLETHSGIFWVSQVMAMSEEELLACHYFGNIIMPDFVEMLHRAGYQW